MSRRGQGELHGTVKRDQARGTWQFVVDLGPDKQTDKRRQMRRRGFLDEMAAQRALLDVLTRIDSEDEVVSRGRLTVEGYTTEWLEGIRRLDRLSAAAWTNYRHCLRLYVTPHIGMRRLETVKPSTLTSLYGVLRERGGKNSRPLSATTVRLVHKVISKALADAVEDGTLASNPASRAKVPPPVRPDTAVWSPENARTFLAFVRQDRLYPAWLLAVHCGLRRGELAGLRWQDLDLDRGGAAIEQQRTTDGDGHLVTKGPKGKSRRTVALGADVVTALRELRIKVAGEREFLGVEWDESACVFTHSDSSPLFPERFTTAFQAAIVRAGVPRIRLHDARHTAATLMILEGVAPNTVQALLGHYSAAFTLDRYAHVLDRMKVDAADRMGNLLRERPAAIATVG
jgi:integrase